jgi:hypothetical protein
MNGQERGKKLRPNVEKTKGGILLILSELLIPYLVLIYIVIIMFSNYAMHAKCRKILNPKNPTVEC